MQYSKLEENIYLIRLEKGEEFIVSLQKFCIARSIDNAYFAAIGSVENPKLAHYMVSTKKYTEKELVGIYEVTALIGNVALFEGKPLIHAHASLSDEHMRGFGGHIVETTVSATVEVFLTRYNTQLEKKLSEEIGLKLWELPDTV